MNLAYKKILGKFTKVLGFGKTPPPHVGKSSQMISFFFLRAYLNCDKDTKMENKLFDILIYNICIYVECSADVKWEEIRSNKKKATIFAAFESVFAGVNTEIGF